MTDLKELIEQELDQYLEWPTADKSHVTTVSAKLFAEHVATLYADHIPDAGKMVSDQLRGGTKKIGRPQIREAFLRNGAHIEPDRDDLPDYVYESVFELLEMAAPAVQGELVACVPDQAKNERQATLSVDSERQAPDVSALVEALELAIEYWRDRQQRYKNRKPRWVADAESALAAHRKQGGEA